ncbi:MAG: hypothetical protein ACYDHF_06165 [Candidatus Cryosericum sp.]
MKITPAQCRDARVWFCLGKICGDCPGKDGINIPPPVMMMTKPEFIPSPPRSRVGGVQQTSRGPTLATALRLATLIFPASFVTEKINVIQKASKTKPRRPCPPGMTPAVARRLGLM